MATATINKRRKHNKSLEQLDGFSPKYVYYDMQTASQQNSSMPVEQAVTSYGLVNNEKTRI